MAISCNLNNSVLKTSFCGYALNSVKDLYLANKNDVDEISYDTDGAVSAVTLADSAKWNRIEPSTDSASYTDALAVIDGGGKYRTHTVTFSMAGDYTPAMVSVVDALSLGEFVAVARLASGSFVLLGSKAVGLTADEVQNIGAGSATEFSGVQVTLSADVTVTSAPLSAEAITALEANVAEALK